MNKSTIFDGIAYANDNTKLLFHYESGKMTISAIPEENAMIPNTILTDGFSSLSARTINGDSLLFHLSAPYEGRSMVMYIGLDLEENQSLLTGKSILNIDYVIEKYSPGAEYDRFNIYFPELEMFCPSQSITPVVKIDSRYIATFESKEEEVFSFEFEKNTVPVNFSLKLYNSINMIDGKLKCETKNKIVIGFPATTDIDFILDLYYLVRSFFSIVFNRRNFSLMGFELHGSFQRAEDKRQSVLSAVSIIDKYIEVPDTKTRIRLGHYVTEQTRYDNFKKLFMLCLEEKTTHWNIHASNRARNLVDLNQFLSITATFEHYYRTFCPRICSDVNQEKWLSLEQKIIKIYSGYTGHTGSGDSIWASINEDECLTCTDDTRHKCVKMLAKVANDFRNELAHEKREYLPTEDVIHAIRLVEKINFFIVLRAAGYPDENIRGILEEILR